MTESGPEFFGRVKDFDSMEPADQQNQDVPAPPKDRSRLKFSLAVLMALAAGGFLIYSNSYPAGFYSDGEMIPITVSLIKTFKQLAAVCGSDVFGISRCVPFLTFFLNGKLGGLDPWGFHLVNILIHVGASFLVYRLVMLTLKTPRGAQTGLGPYGKIIAAAAAGIFLTHPVQTQAVTYIWQRFALLAAFFYLASLVFYARARLRQSLPDYAACLAAMLLGFFSKPNTFTLPLMILFYEGTFFGWRRREKIKTGWFLWVCVAAIVAIGCASFQRLYRFWEGYVSWSTYFSPLAYNGRMTVVGLDYLWTQMNVVRTYVRLLFFPVNLKFVYFYPFSHGLFEPQTFLSFLFLAAILVAAAALYRKQRLLSFAIFWFFITLSVESTLIPLKDVIFEHRLYLPMAGFAVFLPACLCLILKDRRRIVAVLSVILVIFSVMAFRRNFAWSSEVSLWTDAVKKEPDAPQAHHNLAVAYSRRGETDKALAEYGKTLDILKKLWGDPGKDRLYLSTLHNLGVIKLKEGRLDEAGDYFSEVLRNDGRYPRYQTVMALGVTELRRGKVDKAISRFQMAQRTYDDLAEIRLNLGAAFSAKGNFSEAREHYRRALAINPDYAEAHNGFGLLLARQGLYDEAVSEYEKAVALRPDPDFYNNLGDALENRGEIRLAAERFQNALTLDPRNARAARNLLRVLKRLQPEDVPAPQSVKNAEK